MSHLGALEPLALHLANGVMELRDWVQSGETWTRDEQRSERWIESSYRSFIMSSLFNVASQGSSLCAFEKGGIVIPNLQRCM